MSKNVDDNKNINMGFDKRKGRKRKISEILTDSFMSLSRSLSNLSFENIHLQSSGGSGSLSKSPSKIQMFLTSGFKRKKLDVSGCSGGGNNSSTAFSMKEIVKDKYPRPKFISLFMPEFQICPHMLDHNFIIKGQLGTGAFGSVLEVMKKDENGKRYALKIQEKTKIFLLKNERQIKMEALIQSSMPSHPFIAKFFNTWQSKTHLYTLMEIIEKGDLFTEWDRQNGFSEDLIRIYGAEVALALDFLHSRRIIHRDIKLENIIVDGLGNLKLVDFGLSKILNNNCLANTILGTLQYMAPEIRYGMPYNECVDWWSLGVMMSIMFTCQYPFPVANVKRHEDLTFKGYCSPNGSLSFQIVVDNLLQILPQKRITCLGLLKEQIFFRNLNFNAIYQGRIRPILLWKKDDQIQRNKKRRIEKNVGNYFEEFDLTLTDHKEWLGETSDNNCIWERESSGIGSDSKCSDLF